MPIFKIHNSKASQVSVKEDGFGNEAELRDFFAANLDEILGVRFLEKEYPTTDGRIDTVGIDENNSPVIIEYKWKDNEEVLAQGLFYFNWLMRNRKHFPFKKKVHGLPLWPISTVATFQQTGREIVIIVKYWKISVVYLCALIRSYSHPASWPRPQVRSLFYAGRILRRGRLCLLSTISYSDLSCLLEWFWHIKLGLNQYFAIAKIPLCSDLPRAKPESESALHLETRISGDHFVIAGIKTGDQNYDKEPLKRRGPHLFLSFGLPQTCKINSAQQSCSARWS